MKRFLSLILSFVIVLSAIPFSALLANAESAEMTITPSRYGAWENWINSPNIVGDYDAVTQLLLEATDASGNPLVLPAAGTAGDADNEAPLCKGSCQRS